VGEKFANCAPDTGIICRPYEEFKTQFLGTDNPIKDGSNELNRNFSREV
jgi:hypothetical protein